MMRLGVAFGSGGAEGLAHVDVLSVLEQERLRPFYIAGTRMGAIVGALYADLLDIETIVEKIRACSLPTQIGTALSPEGVCASSPCPRPPQPM
jgi:predicted acylesterase/phospholipase RssA